MSKSRVGHIAILAAGAAGLAFGPAGLASGVSRLGSGAAGLPPSLEASADRRSLGGGGQARGLLVRHGQLYDGTGAPPRRADLRVAGDRITAVAASLEPRNGERVIDATGLAVAPGFIDSHSHAGGG